MAHNQLIHGSGPSQVVQTFWQRQKYSRISKVSYQTKLLLRNGDIEGIRKCAGRPDVAYQKHTCDVHTHKQLCVNLIHGLSSTSDIPSCLDIERQQKRRHLAKKREPPEAKRRWLAAKTSSSHPIADSSCSTQPASTTSPCQLATS